MERKITIEVSEAEYEQIRKLREEEGVRYEPVEVKAPLRGETAARKRGARNRQVRKSLYYLGSDNLYRENLYYIRDYPVYQDVIENADKTSRGYEEPGVRKDSSSDPTFHSAVREIELTEARTRIQIIDDALQVIPESYREGVFRHIVDQESLQGSAYDRYSVKTWKRWTQRFVYEVARRRGLEEFVEVLRSC
ncbi:MAG: hypothetical protein IJH77_00985 [Mogibacterium sp.]|nr:hypothetical protein [Mogibacterium sp.]